MEQGDEWESRKFYLFEREDLGGQVRPYIYILLSMHIRVCACIVYSSAPDWGKGGITNHQTTKPHHMLTTLFNTRTDAGVHVLHALLP
jgi:hypothetical protein